MLPDLHHLLREVGFGSYYNRWDKMSWSGIRVLLFVVDGSAVGLVVVLCSGPDDRAGIYYF